jgi:hypothetical protein
MKTYRRGQVDWALWRVKAFPKTTPAPAEFQTRIRRLLEIDRAEPAAERFFSPYAFAETAPGGKGEEAAFHPIDALMLWLGLDLLEMGFKQQEVVRLLRAARTVILKRYGRDLKRAYDDLAVNELLMAPRVELSEHAWSSNARPFLIAAEEVADVVLDKNVRKAVVLAVGLAAFELAETLPQAPEIRRGRPAAE